VCPSLSLRFKGCSILRRLINWIATFGSGATFVALAAVGVFAALEEERDHRKPVATSYLPHKLARD
jgi:hypothetical protein